MLFMIQISFTAIWSWYLSGQYAGIITWPNFDSELLRLMAKWRTDDF